MDWCSKFMRHCAKSHWLIFIMYLNFLIVILFSDILNYHEYRIFFSPFYLWTIYLKASFLQILSLINSVNALIYKGGWLCLNKWTIINNWSSILLYWRRIFFLWLIQNLESWGHSWYLWRLKIYRISWLFNWDHSLSLNYSMWLI
jgi:hypothetical protein